MVEPAEVAPAEVVDLQHPLATARAQTFGPAPAAAVAAVVADDALPPPVSEIAAKKARIVTGGEGSAINTAAEGGATA